MTLNYISRNIIFDTHKKKFIDENLFWEKIAEKNLNIIGSFACIKKTKDGYFLSRDPSGSKKIFYGISKKNKKVIISNNFLQLINQKKTYINSIKSVQKGSVIKIDRFGKIIWQKYFSQNVKGKLNYEKYIKDNLILFLKELKKIHGDSCVVCLSGGLDSSIVAYYASKIFKKLNLVNVSLEYKNNNDKTKHLDTEAASKVSKYLGCKLIKIKIKEDSINSKNLRKIMFASQDYRDFNIHCATLNYFIAKKLSNKMFVITGDFMNEYFADYKEEEHRGKKYYKNPNVDKKLLQTFFMRSLDSSDREVGIFNYFRVPLYQPYCIFFNYFRNFSINKLLSDNIKYKMNSKLIPKKLYKLILKEKTRAQVGDSQGGILGIFVKKRKSSNYLKKFFIKNFSIPTYWLKKFFNLGSYKV